MVNTIYTEILKYCGLAVDDDGYISIVMGDSNNPLLLKGKRMVLPIKSQTENPNLNEKIYFHPLCENILRGESEVIGRIRDLINIKLNMTFAIVVQNIINILITPELHKKLTPDQAEWIFTIKDIDNNTLQNFLSIQQAAGKKDSNSAFIHIYLKRGGVYNSNRCSRVGITSFSLYEKLVKNEDVYGVKLRVKDKKALLAIYKLIFPDIDGDPDMYNFGSKSNTAPYLEALMRTSLKTASKLNDVVFNFSDMIEDGESLIFSDGWVEYFDSLESLIPEIRKIPSLSIDNTASVAPVNAPPAPQYPQQAPYQPPPPFIQQQQYQPQPPYQQPYPPNAGYNAPQMPEIKRTKNGIDFESVKQLVPSVNYAPNPLANQLMAQQMAQQQQAYQNYANQFQQFQGGQQQYPGQMPGNGNFYYR